MPLFLAKKQARKAVSALVNGSSFRSDRSYATMSELEKSPASGRADQIEPSVASDSTTGDVAEASISAVPAQGEPEAGTKTPTFKRGFRFWGVITALCAVSAMAALENSVVVTAGPAIVADLSMGENYIWISNAFFLSRYGCSHLILDMDTIDGQGANTSTSKRGGSTIVRPAQ